MSGIKRFVLILFALLGFFCLITLIMPWTGPLTGWATQMFALDWYFYLVEGATLLCFLGCFALLIFACTKGKEGDIYITNASGDEVAIARSAIASQAKYLAEEDGLCKVKNVQVRNASHKKVGVKFSLEPKHSFNLQEHAEVVQNRVREGLASMIGDRVGTITVRYLQPSDGSPLTNTADEQRVTSYQDV